MKINYSAEVHSLVHSLNSAEKAYFKRSLSKRSDIKLANVFDIINKKAEYDEKYLNEKITPIYTSSTSAYRQLENSILRSISRYRSDSTAQSELNTLLIQIEFLFNRRLYKIGKRLIKRGLKISRENNLFTYTLLFLDQSLTFLSKQENKNNKPTEVIYAEIQKLTEYQAIAFNQRMLNKKLVAYSVHQKLSRKSLKFFYDDIIKSNLLTIPKEVDRDYLLLTVKGLNVRNGAYFNYGDWEKALKGSLELLDIFGPPESLPEHLLKSWMAVNNNIVTISSYLLEKESYMQARKRIEDGMKLKAIENDKVGNLSPVLWDLLHFINSGQLDKAYSLAESQLKPHYTPDLISYQEVNMRITIAQILFYQERYKEAINQISLLMNDSSTKETLNARGRLRWPELFSAYFLEDASLFKSKALAITRYLKQNDSGFDWELGLVDMLKKTFDVPAKKRMELFTSLFNEVKQHQHEFRATAHGFNLLHFIEAMSLGMPMNKFMAKKYLAK